MAKNNNNEEIYDYLVLKSDGMMDISSGSPGSSGIYNDGFDSENFRDPDEDNRKKKIIIIASVAAAAVVLGAAGIILFQMNKAPETTERNEFIFSSNTVISGIDISGRTFDEAKKLLEKNQGRFITPITFDINVDNKNIQLKETDFSYSYNIDEILEQIKTDTQKNPFTATKDSNKYTIVATVTDDSITSAVGKICDDIDIEPKNAYVTEFKPYGDKRFSIADSVNGQKVNAKELSGKIKEGFTKGEAVNKISAEVEAKNADMNAKELESSLVKLSTFETKSTNTENGTSNMKLALSACNGSVIEPGEKWSFNSCTGNTSLESNGYKKAHLTSGEKSPDGIGGGVWQASSTIYNAAVRADMDIEERHNYKWASSYVPTGLDATVEHQKLDLVLSNPTKDQMFIECKVEGSTLRVSIWGVKSGDWDEIHTRNEISEKNSKTYSVKAWRIFIKNGREVDREELSKSTYDADNGVVFVEADNDPEPETTTTTKRNDDDSDDEESSSRSRSSYSSPEDDDDDRGGNSGGGGGGGNSSSSSTPSSSSHDDGGQSSIPVIETDPPSEDDSSSDTPSQSETPEDEPPEDN